MKPFLEMEILVLPVSGGGFVVQLSELLLLTSLRYRPVATLASSGGNVAAYVASAGDWTPEGIRRVSSNINQRLFIQPWSSVAAIAALTGFFRGAAYRYGSGATSLLTTYFTPTTILTDEIWTGTYNQLHQRARLFCNKSSGSTCLDASLIDNELTLSIPPGWAEGNIGLIANYSVASASIPAIVPPQWIDGEPYLDGGVATSSPLVMMRQPIVVAAQGRSLHIVYLNSVDLATSNQRPCYNIVDTWRQATYDLVRSSGMIDRLTAHELISRYGKLQYNQGSADVTSMKLIRNHQAQCTASLLELYPKKVIELNLMNFSGSDVTNLLDEARQCLLYRYWWVGPELSMKSEAKITTDAPLC